MKKKAKGQTGRLREALADVTDLTGSQPAQKDSVIIFRVSSTEKEQVREVAAGLGLSVSAYLLELHRVARERLGG